MLGWWLAERQTSGGGLNGRPEKLPDVGVFGPTFYFLTRRSGVLLALGSVVAGNLEKNTLD